MNDIMFSAVSMHLKSNPKPRLLTMSVHCLFQLTDRQRVIFDSRQRVIFQRWKLYVAKKLCKYVKSNMALELHAVYHFDEGDHRDPLGFL